MRRSLGAIHRSPIGNVAATLCLIPYPAFSTAAGGRGRGRGSPLFSDPAAPDIPAREDDVPTSKPGLGHGRGKPPAPIPTLRTESPFAGAGRGRATAEAVGIGNGPKLPIFFTRNDPSPSSIAPEQAQGQIGGVATRSDLHLGIVSALSGGGRGKTDKEKIPSDRPIGEVKVENRHLKAKQTVKFDEDKEKSRSGSQKLSREDAVRKAMGILSKGDGVRGGEEERQMDDAGGRGGRNVLDKDDDFGAGLYFGDEADEEKLAKRLGPEKMDMLVEAFEEASRTVLPSPMEDAYIDALDTNMMIECEPEYLMEEFGTNPDIDDTPPIPLRDALEKMKPFLMAYENIKSHEEWEKIVEETMEKVPLMKEIVNSYSGPNRVTAMQQQKELQRVANTLPEKAHASVKRFTDRAILSLQSNPGWGFDKKCQFMDKLVWEVSQHYK